MAHRDNENEEEILEKFFSFIFEGVAPEYYTTIIGFNGKSGATFIESYTVDAVAKIVECVQSHRNDPKTNIYFRTSYLSEKPAPGKRGDEDATIGTNLLWLDLDVYNTGKTHEEALDALENFTPRPTVVWFTGRGIQACWKLLEFCDDKFAIKARNKWLEEQFRAYGSDNTSDLTRVFRVPTTFNHKTDPPRQAELKQIRLDRIYTLSDFGWLAPEPFVYGEPIEEEPLPDNFLSTIHQQNPMVYDRIYTEATARKANAPMTNSGKHIDRSKNDWFIACSMLSLGYSKGQIMQVLTHSVWFSGERFRERKKYDYINRTLQKAVGNIGGDPGQYFEGKSFIPERLYHNIVKGGGHFLRLTGMEEALVSGIWYYSDGVYNRNGEQYIREEAVQRLGTQWKSVHAEETIKHCRADRDIPTHSIYAEPIRHSVESCQVNTLSGILNVGTGILEPHTPDNISFIQIPVRYNPEITSTVVADFIKQVLPEDAVDTFWEFVGYCLLQDCRYKKALFLIGERDTGKSTILDLLKRFLGHNNTVSTSLQDIADSRFDRIMILNKLANIFPDLPATKLKDAGTIKAMTSGDAIKGERKYENAVSFYPTAKHVYSANAFVPTSDPDIDAFVERWLVIPLSQVFRPRPQTGREQKANTRLIDALATPENLSEMLNLAVEGLRRLLTQDGFTEAESLRRALDEYRATLDSVYAYVIMQSERVEDGYETKEDWQHGYVSWCRGDDNRMAVGGPNFYRRMKYLLDRPELGLSEGKRSMIRPGETKARETYVYKGRKLLRKTEESIPHSKVLTYSSSRRNTG